MPKQLQLAVTVRLPDDPFRAAQVYGALQPAWETLLKALEETGATYELRHREMRARLARKRTPAKKGKVVPITAPPPEAA